MNFYRTIKLPVFFNDIQSEAECHGYAELGFGYDGIVNKVRIQPMVRNAESGSLEAFGQDYTIGVSHLNRIISEANSQKI